MPVSLLVLTDFHQPANRALNYAASLAGAIGAGLVLLHVRRDSALDPERLTGKLSGRSREAVDLALGTLTSNRAVPAVAEVGHGRVADAVAEAIGHHHPALVVLGLPDTGSTPDDLVSATALDLLRAAPYPMLVIPHDAPAPVVPRRVLLAVDGENFTLGAHTVLVRAFFTALRAQLTVLHVYSCDTEVEDAAARESVARTGLTAGLTPVTTRNAMSADPAEGILAVAATGPYDLIALIARPRSFWGELFEHSVTVQVLLSSRLPVLVLPAQ